MGAGDFISLCDTLRLRGVSRRGLDVATGRMLPELLPDGVRPDDPFESDSLSFRSGRGLVGVDCAADGRGSAPFENLRTSDGLSSS